MRYVITSLLLYAVAFGGHAVDFQIDEGSGTTTYDSRWNDIYGTLVNSPTWVDDVDGIYVEFDGTNYITFADDYFDFGTADFTVSCWVKSEYDADEYRVVWGNFSEETNGVALLHDVTGAFTLYTSYIGNATWVDSAATYLTDEWHHVVTYRDTTTLSISVDDVLTQDTGVVRDITSGTTAYIGHSDSLGTDNLVGAVGSVTVSEPEYTGTFNSRHGKILPVGL